MARPCRAFRDRAGNLISARSAKARGRTTRLGIYFAGGGAALENLSAFAFHFRGAPWAGGAAVQAFADVAAQLLQFQRAQLVLGFHEAQCLAHDFAGGVVASGGDFLATNFSSRGGRLMFRGMERSGLFRSQNCTDGKACQ